MSQKSYWSEPLNPKEPHTMEAITTVQISVPGPQQTYQGVSLPSITDRGQIVLGDEVLSTTEAITTAAVLNPQQTYQGVSLPSITDQDQIVFEDETRRAK